MKKENFLKLPTWLKFNVFYRTKLTQGYNEAFDKEAVRVHALDANLISSEKVTGKHALLLDLDQQVYIVDSSTSGHKHVYIDADLEPEALKEIVDVLAKHGILQQGIKKQMDTRGFLGLRPPGMVKDNDLDDANIETYNVIKDTQLKGFKDLHEKVSLNTLAAASQTTVSKMFTDFGYTYDLPKMHPVDISVMKYVHHADSPSLLNYMDVGKVFESTFQAKTVVNIKIPTVAVDAFLTIMSKDLDIDLSIDHPKSSVDDNWKLLIWCDNNVHYIAAMVYDFENDLYRLEFKEHMWPDIVPSWNTVVSYLQYMKYIKY